MAGKAKDNSKTVWVRNTGSTSITVKAPREDGSVLTKTFAREKVNRITQEIESRGYTSVTRGELEELVRSSKILTSFIDNKTLIVYENAPEEAFSDAERIVILETKITELEGRLANADGAKELAAAEKKIKALEESLKEANARIEELSKKEFDTQDGE